MKRMWFIFGFVGLSIFLLQHLNLSWAKDPDYPVRPIELYIPMSAGGSTDLASRALINAANKHLAQPIVPINKTGGGGTIAAMAVKTAKPDGYALGSITMSGALTPPFSENPPYKDLTCFTWIVNFGTFVFPVMVRNDAPWKTWKEFIEWARKNPRAAKIGITGSKYSDYKALVLWQVEQREKAKFTYIAFKGSGEVLGAILGGHINVYSSTVDASTMAYVQKGDLRIIGYLGDNKVKGYEDIPSTKNLYGVEIPDLLAIIGPQGLPDYVVKKLEDVFAKAVKDPDFLEVMSRIHMPVIYMPRVTLMKHIDEAFAFTAKAYEKLKAEEPKEKK